MATIEADVGRTTGEDRLLSRFFGTVGIADRESVLGALMEEMGIAVARGELMRIHIDFWQPYFRATPSLLLEGESTLVFVEGVDDLNEARDRLVLEFEEGLKGSAQFALVIITGDVKEPEGIASLREALTSRHRSGRLLWTSWQRLYKRLHAIERRGDLDGTSHRLVGEAAEYLKELGYFGFVGFPPDTFAKATAAQKELKEFSQYARIFLQEVTTAVEGIGLSPYMRHVPASAAPESWAFPSQLRYAFREETWEGFELAGCEFYVKVHLEAPLIWAGYRLDLTSPARRAFLTEKRGALSALVESEGGLFIALQNGEDLGSVTRWIRAGKGGLGFLESREALLGVEHADIAFAFSSDDLGDPALPARLAARLAWLREKVLEVGLYPKPETDPARRFVITNL